MLIPILSLVSAVLPQSQPTSQPATGPIANKIVVQNLAPLARYEWARVVVPFARGSVHGEPKLHVKDKPTVWQPFGARWPDGSLRQALCMFPVRMAAMQELELSLQPGASTAKVAESVPQFGDGIRIAAKLDGDQQEVEVRLPTGVILERNAARCVELRRCRIGKTGLLCECTLTAYAGQPWFDLSVAVFFSDPESADMVRKLQSLQVRTGDWRFVVRHARRTSVHDNSTAADHVVTLLANDHLADGQGIRRVGVLIPRLDEKDRSIGQDTIRAASICPLVAATTWDGTGAFGPFGVIPELPPWLHGPALRTALAKRHATFVQQSMQWGNAFDDFGLGLTKNPGRTGTQPDFGTLKMTPVVRSGLPSFLLEVELSVLQEACRPVHYFEKNAQRLLAVDHPNWVVWSGRTHWHCRVSTDRLGKPCPEPEHDRHGWDGKDRQHWSSNYLCGYYLLTADAWALLEIEQEVELFLAGQTVREGLSTSNPDAPRGAARALMAACWLYQCTGSQALLARIHERMQKIYIPTWTGRQWDAAKVRLMEIRRGEQRHLGDGITFWAPWQESMAAVAFAAVHRLTGSKEALEMARGLAETTTRHGWGMTAEGPRVGYAMAWNDDATPLSVTEHGDRKRVIWADGGISAWSLGAVELARQFASLDGDKALEQRAVTILNGMRRGRRPPRDGWFDDFGDWDAVR